MELIELGVHTVHFGIKDDPKRIEKMSGGFLTFLDDNLDPDRFADKGEPIRKGKGIEDWDVGGKEVELVAAFMGIGTHDYSSLMSDLSSLPPGLHKGSFPHLSSQFTEKKLEVLWREGFHSIVAPDESGLRRDFHDQLGVPEMVCARSGCYLVSHPIIDPFDSDVAYLLYRN